MWRSVLKLLTTPLAKNKTTHFISSIKSKPLNLNTNYISSACSQQNLTAHFSPITIDKQCEILRQHASYQDAIIATDTLEKNSILIGLTKHPQTILQGVFMYPESIKYSPAWKTVLDLAAENQSGIAYFTLAQSISCVKMQKNLTADIAIISYLIHYRLLSCTKWLSFPPKKF